MRFSKCSFLTLALVAALATTAHAQTGPSQMVIAVPQLPTPKNVQTDGGETGVIGIQIAQQIASDLRSSGNIVAINPDKLRVYTPTEAGAPIYQNWTNAGAGALVQGYVQ